MGDVAAPSLQGRGVLVVGASSGIGRAVAVAAAERGARVVAAARRFDRLRELAAEHPGAIEPVQCDVRAAISCDLAVRTAAQRLGGVDTVVFATGVNHLGFLADTDHDAWLNVLETNVIGAAMVTRAVLPHLRQAESAEHRPAPVHPRVAYLSSDSVASPWPALGAYVTSKAALEKMIEVWRIECADVTFARIVVGPTLTGMADAWEPDLAQAMFDIWYEQGYLSASDPVEAAVVAADIIDWVAAEHPAAELDLSPAARA